MSPSIQQNALQAGGFGAIAAPLSLEELSPNSLAGLLHRGLLLQGISLMAGAFDLSPMLLPGPLLQQLIETVVDTVKGELMERYSRRVALEFDVFVDYRVSDAALIMTHMGTLL